MDMKHLITCRRINKTWNSLPNDIKTSNSMKQMIENHYGPDLHENFNIYNESNPLTIICQKLSGSFQDVHEQVQDETDFSFNHTHYFTFDRIVTHGNTRLFIQMIDNVSICCLLYYIFCLLYYIFCLLYYIFCLLY